MSVTLTAGGSAVAQAASPRTTSAMAIRRALMPSPWPRDRRRGSVLFAGRRGVVLDGHVAGARRARLEALGHFAARVDEGAAHGLDVGAEDALAVGARPVVGAPDRVDRALEARHDVAGEELVALEGLVARRPLVGAEEQAANAAVAQADQALDAFGHRVRRAHEGGAH